MARPCRAPCSRGAPKHLRSRAYEAGMMQPERFRRAIDDGALGDVRRLASRLDVLVDHMDPADSASTVARLAETVVELQALLAVFAARAPATEMAQPLRESIMWTCPDATG